MRQDLPPLELAKVLSRGKAENIAKKNSNAVVIGADTFIIFEGKILGKPHDEKTARRILTSLNGKQHSVITGYTIIDTDSQKTISNAVESKVHFKKVSAKELDDYIATGEPLDKAGAYAIQEKGAFLIDHIEGDYDNIVGLPIKSVVKSLEEFGKESR